MLITTLIATIFLSFCTMSFILFVMEIEISIFKKRTMLNNSRYLFCFITYCSSSTPVELMCKFQGSRFVLLNTLPQHLTNIIYRAMNVPFMKGVGFSEIPDHIAMCRNLKGTTTQLFTVSKPSLSFRHCLTLHILAQIVRARCLLMSDLLD